MSKTGFRKTELIQCLHDSCQILWSVCGKVNPGREKREKMHEKQQEIALYYIIGQHMLSILHDTFKWFVNFWEFYSHCFQVITVLSFAHLEKYGWGHKIAPSDCLFLFLFLTAFRKRTKLGCRSVSCGMTYVMVTKSWEQPAGLRYSALSTLYTF